ncbi:unnamed protein product [Prorocentrum cordatum]|uniref:PPM-type phosphatase domain-containing protein n=1 Tax=Prorocentrum cordatum TaxID=2364126 RepID=A0ABN9WMA2_9DINO|nr:unnamed protein product [Polarella glacialis]
MLCDSAAMQGRRPKQEDRHVKVPDLTKAAMALKMPIGHLEQPCGFFAVYDGHQGHACSEYVAKTFHLRLLKKLSADKCGSSWTDERLCSALRESCEELDKEFLAKFRTAPDGSTAVVSLVTGARLFVAWLGDSRCLLCRETSQGGLAAVALTEDHRPSLKSEAERVKKAGGAVVNFDGALRVAHVGYEERVREIRRAKAQGLGDMEDARSLSHWLCRVRWGIENSRPSPERPCWMHRRACGLSNLRGPTSSSPSCATGFPT